MMTLTRGLIGLIVAPSLPALAFHLIGLMLGAKDDSILISIILTMLGYMAAIVIGLPTHVLMTKRNIRSLKAYVIMGAAIGLTVYIAFFSLTSYQSYQGSVLLMIRNFYTTGIVAIGYAIVASGLFWLIAVRGLED
jgi:uncharacterized membrane protein YqaE (UPF0057 family)